jgi:hypothetical protein
MEESQNKFYIIRQEDKDHTSNKEMRGKYKNITHHLAQYLRGRSIIVAN